MKTAKNLLLWVLICAVMAASLPMGVLALTEIEDNNTMATAQSAVLGELIECSIADANDEDFYRIDLPHAGALTLNMTSYLNYYSIFLYDSTGEPMWYSESNEWDADTCFRNDVYTFDLAAGTYFVTVNGVDHHSSGIYHYYDKYTGNYSLLPSFVSANTTETEPNNSTDEALSIAPGDIATGQIAINDRFDFYRLTLPESGQLTLEMTSYLTYYSLFLYDSDGSEIWNAKSNPQNAPGSYTLNLRDGTYFLKVTGENHYIVGIYEHCESHTGNYSLTTSFTPTAPGDADGSGTVDFFDGMLVLQYYAGLIDDSGLLVAAADVDNSGEISFFDGMYILQFYAGLLEMLPVTA